MAPLYTVGVYSYPSWSPALLNVAFIGMATAWYLWGFFDNPAWALVVGAWVGGIAQLGLTYWAMGRYTGVWKPSFKFNHPELMTILFLLGPVAVGQAAGEVNKLIDTLFAATLEEGTVRALFVANRMVQLPLSIFGIATSIAILPTLSKKSSSGDVKAVQTTLLSGLRSSFFLVVPASVGLIVLAHPIIHVVFERGNFGPNDTARTAVAMQIYGAGLLSFAWVKVLLSGFYSKKDTKTPVIISSLCMGMNILLNFVFIGPLGYAGLPLATTIAFFLNVAFLYGVFSANVIKLWSRDYGEGLLKMTVASILMGTVAFGLYRMLGAPNVQANGFWRFGSLLRIHHVFHEVG
jgi:putative peptidoglycan lipid II flippase